MGFSRLSVSIGLLAAGCAVGRPAEDFPQPATAADRTEIDHAGNVQTRPALSPNSPPTSAVPATQPVARQDETYVFRKIFVGGEGLVEEFTIRRRGNDTVLEWHDGKPAGLVFTGSLAPADWRRFQKALHDATFSTLPDLKDHGWDGVEYTLAHVGSDHPRELTINNPSTSEVGDPPLTGDALAYTRVLDAIDEVKRFAKWRVRDNEQWSKGSIRVAWSSVFEEAISVREVDGLIWLRTERRGTTSQQWYGVIYLLGPMLRLEPLPEGIQPRREPQPPKPLPARMQYPVIAGGERYVFGVVDDTLHIYSFSEQVHLPVPPELARYAPVAAVRDDEVLLVHSEVSPTSGSISREYRIFNLKTMKATPTLPVEQRVWTQNLPPVSELQHAAEPDVVWMAYPSDVGAPNESTVVGRYSLKNLKFRNSATFEGVRFDTSTMVVDVPRNQVLALQHGVLLELPLPRDIWKDAQ